MEAWLAVVTLVVAALIFAALATISWRRLSANCREYGAARRYKRSRPSGSRLNYIAYLGESRLQLITEAPAPMGFPKPSSVESQSECFAYLERSREISYGWLLGKEAVTLLAASAGGAAVGAAVTDYQSQGWNRLVNETLPDYLLIFSLSVLLLAVALAFQETRLRKWRQAMAAYAERLEQLRR